MVAVNVEISGDALRRYVEPIEKLMEERRGLNRRITGTYRKAKEAGFQPPILRMIISERALDHQVWADQQALLRTYRDALGMIADMPLGEAAMQRAEDDVATRRAANIALTEVTSAERRANGVEKPKPFGEQPVHPPRPRGRPRKPPVLFDQDHPQGTA